MLPYMRRASSPAAQEVTCIGHWSGQLDAKAGKKSDTNVPHAAYASAKPSETWPALLGTSPHDAHSYPKPARAAAHAKSSTRSECDDTDATGAAGCPNDDIRAGSSQIVWSRHCECIPHRWLATMGLCWPMPDASGGNPSKPEANRLRAQYRYRMRE